MLVLHLAGTEFMSASNENEEPELPDLYEDICAIMPGGRFSDVLVGLSTRDVNATNAFLAYVSVPSD